MSGRRPSRLADTTVEAAVMILVLGLVGAGAIAGWAVGHYTAGGTKTVTVASGTTSAPTVSITAAPAFSTGDLSARPTDNWITNGGDLTNDRYSPLNEITTSNVSKLKGLWMIHLHSATAAKYSGESQPLAYKGVIYIPTGEDVVYAIDAATGRTIWTYDAHLSQTISTVCCGWESRGVALGDGRVYLGQLDGRLVALDQKTGKLDWSTVVLPWQQGYTITHAPLYIDGMVITGVSGGEFGIRGQLDAYDAKTGKLVWRFYTIPGPGETGHNTWPATGKAWQHGGAPIWQTPSVDPKLGLLYFTTGNAGPDNNGSARAGMNLFTASMLALDVKTGKLRWYYQMVHHDIWDYDAPSPTLLFDATINGKLVHGIGQAEKTGWLYLLDRTTGKPIFATPEKAVPQNAHQKTWPTQPFPPYAPVVPHTVSQAAYLATVKQAQAQAKTKKAKAALAKAVRAKDIFAPYWHTMVVLTPGPQGGTNWQPSSYDPNTHMVYVCAQAGTAGSTAGTAPPPPGKGAVPVALGSTLTVAGGFGQNPGTFSAVDATTGKIVWQKRWPESCYAGSAATAGGLVFIGRNNGDLQAYDAKSGSLLWSFQTGAGANDAPTIFRLGGHEMLAFYAGGSALAATPHGDNLWLLGLNGTLGPAAAPGAGAGIEHAGAGGQGATTGSAAAGAAVFAANCSTCHGATGHGGNGGPDLTSIPSAKQIGVVIRQVTNGGPGMPAFKSTLSRQQIVNVATYVTQKITK